MSWVSFLRRRSIKDLVRIQLLWGKLTSRRLTQARSNFFEAGYSKKIKDGIIRQKSCSTCSKSKRWVFSLYLLVFKVIHKSILVLFPWILVGKREDDGVQMKGLFSLLYKITIELTDHSFAFLACRYFICYLISAARKEKKLKTSQDLAIMDIYRGQDGPRITYASWCNLHTCTGCHDAKTNI